MPMAALSVEAYGILSSRREPFSESVTLRSALQVWFPKEYEVNFTTTMRQALKLAEAVGLFVIWKNPPIGSTSAYRGKEHQFL